MNQDNVINIKALTLTDPAKKGKGTAFKKAKKIMEDKVFENGDPTKNIMEKNTKNKDIKKKNW
jgi:hypothetical protein